MITGKPRPPGHPKHLPTRRITPRKVARVAKDARCYYCRKKARTMADGHPSCGGPKCRALVPQLRTNLRTGRGSFLRALRGRIEKLRYPADLVPREAVLTLFDEAAEKYTGD